MPSILIIDNDPSVCGLFERVLETAGHSVSVAIEATAGLEMLRGSAIDVVIVDLNMPENMGLEVLAVIRREFPAVKVILVSNGYVRLPDGPLLDTIKVLTKPVGVQELRETVHRVLGYSSTASHSAINDGPNGQHADA